MGQRIICFFLAGALGVIGDKALANWTLNLGYHNPPGSTLGLNFLYFGSKLGGEVGIGWLDVGSQDTNQEGDDDTVTFKVAGAGSLKYFFSSGGFRPYIQGGFGAGIGGSFGSSTGAGAGIGGPFAGLGLFLGSPSFYAYGSALLFQGGDGLGLQAGLGFDI